MICVQSDHKMYSIGKTWSRITIVYWYCFHAAGEYEALKKAVNELIAQNDEKDVKIDELRKAVITYQKVEEIILNSQSPMRRKSEDADTVHSTSLHNGTRLQSGTYLYRSYRQRSLIYISTIYFPSVVGYSIG